MQDINNYAYIFYRQENKSEDGHESAAECNKPILFMLPRGPARSMLHPNRFTNWQKQLLGIGKMLQINVNAADNDEGYASTAYLETVVGVTRTKVSVVKCCRYFALFLLFVWYSEPIRCVVYFSEL